MAERSADWMAQAARDLDSARWAMEGGFFEWACFAAHQAAEKAVKAVYQKLGGDAWGHSVGQLLSALRERVAIPETLLTSGHVLDRFYIPTRYPNSWDEGPPMRYYRRGDAEDAIGRGEEILRFCAGVLAQSG